MALIRKGAIIRKIKDITIGSSLSFALITGAGFIQGCGGSGEEKYETVYTKGVQTFIKEEEKGVFKIADEKVVAPEESKAIVQYLNGNIDTLTLEEAKKIANPDNKEWSAESNNSDTAAHYTPHSHGLGNVLMFGMLGYMLGRNTSYSPNSRYYSNPDVFNKSQQSVSQIQNSRVTRPVNSSKGFFRSSGKSGSGFGG